MTPNKKAPATFQTIRVHSLYWNNIDRRIVDGQQKVFEKLSIPLTQHNRDGLNHGQWLDSLLQATGDGESLIVCDIDAFPITRSFYERCCELIQAGHVVGMAQTCNHSPMPEIPYAGPMFLGLAKETWQKCGQPSLVANEQFDAGQALSIQAKIADVPVTLIQPRICLEPKWPLGNSNLFGVGTFYGDLEFFHLFESRLETNIELFSAVSEDVLLDQFPKLEKYLKIKRQKSKLSQLAKKIRERYQGKNK